MLFCKSSICLWRVAPAFCDSARPVSLSHSLAFACLGVSLSACNLSSVPVTAQPSISHAEQTLARAALRAETADWNLASLSAQAPLDSRADANSLLPSHARGRQQPAPSEHRVSIDAAHVPLSSLLLALARDAELDLRLQSALEGDINFRAEQLPLREVLDALALQVPFTWSIDDRALRVRKDEIFTDSYAVNYLDLQRSTRSRVGLATRVGTLNSSEQDGNDALSVANSSDTLIESQSTHRFWESLADDLEGLLQHEGEPGSRYTLNREAGLVTLHARARVHRRVQRYLERMHDSVGRQVLIEASVVEVTLSDRYQSGIDWQLLASGLEGISIAQVLGGFPAVSADTVDRLTAPTGSLSFVQQTGVGDVAATVSLLEEFGDVRIVSRPRIIALNNQASVLKVVDNRVYFTLTVERSSAEERDQVVTESEIHTVPVGLVMNVTPHIARDGQVMLNVRPTLSRILGFVNDPNPELAVANVANGVPEIQVRELESMLIVESGKVAVIGGLMQNASRQQDRGVAGISSIPYIGKLFSQRSQTEDRSELLIVLRPTVLPRPAAVSAGG